jgi:large subunit ribosomal protein L35
MKQKTHSGAKKRFRVKSRNQIKRAQQGMRHILVNKSSKRKRHLGDMSYVSSANLNNIQKCLNL